MSGLIITIVLGCVSQVMHTIILTSLVIESILITFQVPGADFEGGYAWNILFWYGSTIAVIAGTHILICTIFLSVFGQVSQRNYLSILPVYVL